MKFDDLKNLLYSPSQSPFKDDVNWGPDCVRLFKNSSGLNVCGTGAAFK